MADKNRDDQIDLGNPLGIADAPIVKNPSDHVDSSTDPLKRRKRARALGEDGIERESSGMGDVNVDPDGAAGIDAMTGGAGNDVYVVDVAGDTTVEIAAGGTDTVEASLTWTLATEVENLLLTGGTAINGTGNALANTLTGNSGDNVLNGLAGIDTMIGGLGNDTYIVDATADVITELASAGTDAVQSSATYTLGSNVEQLTMSGSTAINGTGNTLDNLLTGNIGINVLTGAAGNDTLDGAAGADTLVGGTGNDTYVIGRGYAGELIQVAGQHRRDV